MKALIVADVSGWVFDYFGKALQKYCKGWKIDIVYGRKCKYKFKHKPYRIVFFMVDVRPDKLIKAKIPKEKVIIAARSDVTKSSFYKESCELRKYCTCVAVANKSLESFFNGKIDRVRLAEGGVDHNLFYYLSKKMANPPVVGWAGSTKYFDKGYRGVDVLRRACKELGYRFFPAIKEVKYRTQEQMVKYYQSIDIYVDLSRGAGRQNGLLEAGASGKVLISTRVGIAEQLITDGENGFLTDREHIKETLKKAVAFNLGRKMRDEIEKNWTWEAHALKIEAIFNEVAK